MTDNTTHPCGGTSLLNDGVILLRAPEPQDVQAMYVIENDPAIWCDGVNVAPMSYKQLIDYVDNYNGDIYAMRQLRFVMQSCRDGSVVGLIDLYDFDPVNNRAYVGITVGVTHRGKGYGVRSLSMLCQYSKQVLGMYQLAAVTRADNEAAVELFAGAGFERTGLLTGWIRRGTSRIDAIHWQSRL